MLTEKKAKDIMVSIANYPHISSTASLKQAIEVFRKSVLEGENCIKPIVALVFDEKRLAGTLRLRDILKGLEPNFLKASSKFQGYSEVRSELSIIWDTLFDVEASVLKQKPVADVMSPIDAYLNPEDPIVKAAFLMIRNDLLVIPVLENKKKVIGLVRMLEVFDVLACSETDEDGTNILTMRAQA